MALTCAVLSVCGVFGYVGTGAGTGDAILYRLVFDGGVLAAWLGSAAGFGAGILMLVERRSASSKRLLESRILHLTTATALGLGVMSLATLGLGLAGALSQATGIALIVLGLGAGVLPVMRRDRSPGTTARDDRSSAWNWLWLLVVPFAAIMLTADLIPPGLLWKPHEPHGYDVVAYHLQVPREWYEAGRIVPLKHNVFSYFPFNVEMHYLLGMHLTGGPWRAMFLAQLMHGAMFALTIAAACGFAAQFAGDRGAHPARAMLLTGIAVATIPWLTQLGAVAFNEGGLLLYGTLSAGWAIRAASSPQHRLTRFAIAGAMAGFAAGCKLTAVPLVLMAVPVVACAALAWRWWRQWAREPRPPGIILGSGLFLLIGLLVFSPWAIRNLAWAGNPVFPEAARMLGQAHFSDTQVERWEQAHAPRADQKSLGARLGAAWREIASNWQFGYTILAAALAAIVLAYRRPAAWCLGALILLQLAFWLGFTHLQSRFFVLALPWCAMLLACADWGRAWPGVLIAVVAGAAPGLWIMHRYLPERLDEPIAFFDDGKPFFLRETVGRETFEWWSAPLLQDFPRNDAPVRLVLVGEAKAFMYELPMSRLAYRSVFDVIEGDVMQGWTGGGLRRTDWLMIDPGELKRFHATYRSIPEPPAGWAAQPLPFLHRPSERTSGVP